MFSEHTLDLYCSDAKRLRDCQDQQHFVLKEDILQMVFLRSSISFIYSLIWLIFAPIRS